MSTTYLWTARSLQRKTIGCVGKHCNLLLGIHVIESFCVTESWAVLKLLQYI